MIRERRITTAAGQLNIATSSTSNPPLLLLHGVLRRWTDFAIVLPELQSRWQVCGLDFRGHGGSDRIPDQYRVIDYVSDAVSVIETVFQEPVVIVGHSLGAMVAIAAAARCAGRVRGSVLEDPPFHTMGTRIGSTIFASQFVHMKRIVGRTTDVVELTKSLAELEIHTPDRSQSWRLGDLRDRAALRYSAQCLLAVDPSVLDPIADGTWLAGYDVDEILASVPCPTLVLRGNEERGGMLTKADGEKLERVLADCLSVYFPDVGHLIHSLATERYLQAVIPFLESLL